MPISVLIKIVASIIVFTILACTLIIVNNYFGEPDPEPSNAIKQIAELAPDKEDNAELVQIETLRKRISRNDQKEIVLGGPALRKAKTVLMNSEFEEARELLEDVVRKYEGTPAEYEAHRVLGEMNMDDLFDRELSKERYKNYTVQFGDTYLGIAQKFDTNFDLLVLLNGLVSKDSNNLQPDQKLTLMPLNFSLKIIPQKNQLFLMDENGDVLKMYEPIVDMTIPIRQKSVQTSISRMAAYHNNRRVNSTRGNYRAAAKSLRIDNPVIDIIGKTASVAANFKGIVLAKSDMEELILLLRTNNKVEILY